MIYIITGLILIVLFFVDRKKTVKSIKVGLKKMIFQMPIFLTMSALIAISLYFVDDSLIARYLGEDSSALGLINVSVIGSVTLMPGFIAFPLAKLLLEKGVPYMILAGFTNTLMMVGVLSFPVEKEYFGVKVSIIRNIVSYTISIIVAILVGIIYGEVF